MIGGLKAMYKIIQGMFWWVSGGYLVPHPKKSKFLSPKEVM
jgi:hypothetical protein